MTLRRPASRPSPSTAASGPGTTTSPPPPRTARARPRRATSATCAPTATACTSTATRRPGSAGRLRGPWPPGSPTSARSASCCRPGAEPAGALRLPDGRRGLPALAGRRLRGRARTLRLRLHLAADRRRHRRALPLPASRPRHFASLDAACGGSTTEARLGYLRTAEQGAPPPPACAPSAARLTIGLGSRTARTIRFGGTATLSGVALNPDGNPAAGATLLTSRGGIPERGRAGARRTGRPVQLEAPARCEPHVPGGLSSGFVRCGAGVQRRSRCGSKRA